MYFHYIDKGCLLEMINFLVGLTMTGVLLSLYSLENLLVLLLTLEMLVYVLLLLKNWFHIMMILMVLEFMMVKTFLLLGVFSYKAGSFVLLFMFLTIMVIEASLGVSVLSLITRCRGNDFVIN